MAGGPIYASSWYPAATDGSLFPNFYAGGGGNNCPHDEGLGVAASISADKIWEGRFGLPPVIPSGTPKLYFKALANATAGVAPLIVQDAVIPPLGDPSAAVLYTETTLTLSWASVTQYVAISVVLGVGGTGYAVGDFVTCAGGTFSTPCVLRVSTVSAGVVTAFTIIQQGVYSVKPAAGAVTQASTTGSGTGATATLTFSTGTGVDSYIEGKVPLTPTMIADGTLAVALVCHGASSAWTLAAVCTIICCLLWE